MWRWGLLMLKWKQDSCGLNRASITTIAKSCCDMDNGWFYVEAITNTDPFRKRNYRCKRRSNTMWPNHDRTWGFGWKEAIQLNQDDATKCYKVYEHVTTAAGWISYSRSASSYYPTTLIDFFHSTTRAQFRNQHTRLGGPFWSLKTNLVAYQIRGKMNKSKFGGFVSRNPQLVTLQPREN